MAHRPSSAAFGSLKINSQNADIFNPVLPEYGLTIDNGLKHTKPLFIEDLCHNTCICLHAMSSVRVRPTGRLFFRSIRCLLAFVANPSSQGSTGYLVGRNAEVT